MAEDTCIPAVSSDCIHANLSQCIEAGQLHVIPQLLRDGASVSDDSMAVHSIIAFYQKYLLTRSVAGDTKMSELWKAPAILQSETRLDTLEGLRLMLKTGFDPNVAAGVETSLMAAVRTHDKRLIAILLEHGADPNRCGDLEQINAFALSIILNDVEVVEQMLHYGANMNTPCCGSMTPLQLSMNKCVHISKLLLQGGADVQQVLQTSTPHSIQLIGPPLIQAVRSNSVYLASVLLEHGEDVNQAYGENSDTPLHTAVKNGHYKMVELLIQYGANLNKLSGNGHSVLGLSLLSEDKDGSKIAKLLLASGCSRKRQTMISFFQRYYPPIFVACFFGNVEIVDQLIMECNTVHNNKRPSSEQPMISKASPSSTSEASTESTAEDGFTSDEELTEIDGMLAKPKKYYRRKVHKRVEGESMLHCVASDGCTPLLMSAFGGHLLLVKHLLDLGADPHVTCSQGNLVHAAVLSSRGNSLDLLKLCIDLGCSLNLKNDSGNMPLHMSARINQSNICLHLVEQGAQLNVRDKYGETALSASVYFGCEQNSRLLIQHGADMDLVDTSGTTAIYWSIFNCRQSVLKLLLTAGAKFSPESLAKYPRNLKLMRSHDTVAYIHEHICQPRTLATLCVYRVRAVISGLVHGHSIKHSMSLLPVPNKVKASLMLEDIFSDIKSDESLVS